MESTEIITNELDTPHMNNGDNKQITNGPLDEFDAKWGFPLAELYRLALLFFKDKEGKAVHLTYKDKLKLVAYTKQVAHGKYRTDVFPEVGFLDVVGNDRRQAWQALGDMSRESAMAEFIKMLDRLCPLLKPFIQAHRTEKEEKLRKEQEEEERKRLEEEEKKRQQMEEEARKQQELECQRQLEQEMQIRAALNQQTAIQFQQYAETQFPNNRQQQEELIKQLQEQHFQQYMQQVYQQQLVHQQQQYMQLQAMSGTNTNTSQKGSTAVISSPPPEPVQTPTTIDEITTTITDTTTTTTTATVPPTTVNNTDSTAISETNITNSTSIITPDSIVVSDNQAALMSQLATGTDTDMANAANNNSTASLEREHLSNSQNAVSNSVYETQEKELEANGDLNDLPPLAAASMWTRKDIKEFKDSLRNEKDCVIKVGSGETVTVRVPTHEDGTCLFWEFATDYYDIGFGVYFEWTIAPTNTVSVHISDSSDEEELDEEEDNKADLEKGKKKDDRPPTDEIIPVYRRDSHDEVYCGSHTYPGRGVYLLKFDNSYSLWRSKTLYYRVYYTS